MSEPQERDKGNLTPMALEEVSNGIYAKKVTDLSKHTTSRKHVQSFHMLFSLSKNFSFLAYLFKMVITWDHPYLNKCLYTVKCMSRVNV